jgi:GT2 family glycosyltransferase
MDAIASMKASPSISAARSALIGVGTADGLAVIVVNYGTPDLAVQAMASVLDAPPFGRRVEVHVVDNASPGGDARHLADAIAARDWSDRATLWAESRNHGFGRGNNLVLRHLAQRADPPAYVLLLNPDAKLLGHALADMAHVLDQRPAVVAVGAGIALPDGTPVSAAFRFPNPLGEFLQAANFGPLSRLFPTALIPLPPNQPEGPVGWVSGAAVLFRLDALARIGFFDPAFFLYYEEVDLMRRLTAAGGVIWHRPQARVIHVEGAATGVRSHDPKPRPVYWHQSWLTYHLRARGRVGGLLAATALLAGLAIDAVACRLRNRAPAAPPRSFRDFARHVLWPLLTGAEVPHA